MLGLEHGQERRKGSASAQDAPGKRPLNITDWCPHSLFLQPLCFSQYGSSFVLIGLKLQKSSPGASALCLPLLLAAAAQGTGPWKTFCKSKASLFAFLQSGILKTPYG